MQKTKFRPTNDELFRINPVNQKLARHSVQSAALTMAGQTYLLCDLVSLNFTQMFILLGRVPIKNLQSMATLQPVSDSSSGTWSFILDKHLVCLDRP